MNVLGCIQVVFGLLALGYGVMVMRGVLKVTLDYKRARQFLKYGLIASLAGLLQLSHRLSLNQGICMLSVYCSGVAILACLKFHLAGIWRTVFAFLIPVVLYLNVVSLSIQMFEHFPPLTAPSIAFSPCFEITQLCLAVTFAVLGVLAVRSCHAERSSYRETRQQAGSR